MRMLFAIFGLGLTTFAVPVSAQQFVCSGTTNSPYPEFVSTYHDHRRVAPAGTGLTGRFTAFHAIFDDADDDDGDGQADLRLNPEYVVYELRGVAPDRNGNYAEPEISIKRPNKWYASPGLVDLVEGIAGVTNRRIDDSYSGVGTIWNRGHLAMSDHAQRISAEAGCNTHVFWNASPQAADLNQGPWLHLENYSAAASNKYRSVWVVAGPIFDPSTPKLTIGDPGELRVEIPDAFFKVLIHESPSGIDTLAFIFEQPNAAGPDGKPVPTASWVNCKNARQAGHVYDHRPNLVTIEEIERRTGLRFFSDRPNRQTLIRARAQQLWPVETVFWDPGSSCAAQRSHP
ncbi:hypothetical protein GVO57_14390 (plasmid) [Sphingomonas changnyeongensis]|uniref:DNA/RNA non-specific endonuclease n=1 Tax=Sphingomonas changnyeongensis TaxID=2698679 RepID=A0A7Z2NZ36_9SPHN|nr:DNA/RNA non-specific endonuclease [Sphingomonas changnyeongensis]QHL92066.1 hypothetical protein GVO57_14390 [Sphingomonas changnyeongensis]